MGKPKPESRIEVAKRHANLCYGLILDVTNELNEVNRPDAEADTVLFLIDEIQRSLAKTRSHVETYFSERG